MISDISDIYVLCLGMLYPSYKMLQERDNALGVRGRVTEQRDFWEKYFIVFSIAYVATEVLEMALSVMIPFIIVVKVIGVSLLVLPKTHITQSAYNYYIFPFYETSIKVNDNSQTWTEFLFFSMGIFKNSIIK